MSVNWATYPLAKRYLFWWILRHGLRLDRRHVRDLPAQTFEHCPSIGSVFIIVGYCPDHDIGYALLLQGVAFHFPCLCVIKRDPLRTPVDDFNSLFFLEWCR